MKRKFELKWWNIEVVSYVDEYLEESEEVYREYIYIQSRKKGCSAGRR